jgi:aryl-alcohol dehydrogenase-like predicted oxidoreductase
MQHRVLGRSGLIVSRIVLGTMTFGEGAVLGIAGGGISQDAVDHLVGMALEAGVTTFDTADVYTQGASETALGRALAGRREGVVLISKGFAPTGAGPYGRGLSRRHLIAACEASLRRLGTDHLDVYLTHQDDHLTPLDEVAAALDDLVRQGKTRYVGCSNLTAWKLARIAGIQERDRLHRHIVAQVYHSLVGRGIEHGLVPCCRELGVGVMAWSPLAGGLLSGKYAAGGTGRRSRVDYPPCPDAIAATAVAALARIAAAHGVPSARVALAWSLSRPWLDAVVVGARTPEQLAENLAATDLRLEASELAELDAIAAPVAPYPEDLRSWTHPGSLAELVAHG